MSQPGRVGAGGGVQETRGGGGAFCLFFSVVCSSAPACLPSCQSEVLREGLDY